MKLARFCLKIMMSRRYVLLVLSMCIPPGIAWSQMPPASTIQTIYVIPSSHWDFGFVNTPNAVRQQIKPHLDAVMAACDADPQFRWTIESVWQLDAWLEQTKDPVQIQHMADLLHTGQIELSAAYGSMHTEFMGTEELNRLVSAGAEVEQQFKVHPTVAMMNDVPGFSMRLPQALARSGIRYLITGSNTGLGGGAALWPGKVPFHWRSPDGSSVLVWQTQGKNGGYTEGMTDFYLAPGAEDPYQHTKFYPKEWVGLPDIEIMQRGVGKLLKTYSDAGYIQSAVAVLFMHDAIGPEYEQKYLLPGVRAWNAAGKLPHIVVANPSEYFSYLASHAVGDAPAFMGDWSGLWAEVKVNSPAMSADARFLQQRLPQLETLWSLLQIKQLSNQYPGEEIARGYTSLFRYDEHNGAGQGGWPDVLTRQQVLEQNQEYSGWLRTARQSAEENFDAGLVRFADQSAAQTGGTRAVLVYNPYSWSRSQIAKVANLKGAWRVRDTATDQILPSQMLASGELIFHAQNLPSIGYRSYVLEPVESSVGSQHPDAATLESPYYRVEVNPEDGSVVRITDLRAHRVLVDKSDGGHVGDLMRNDVPNVSPSQSEHAILRREKGPVIDSLIITRPGSLWPETTISLSRDEPVIHMDEVLDRSKMRFVAHTQPRDLYAFAFDFSVHGNVQHWVDNGAGLYRFPEEVLPGARRDAVVPRHSLVWSEEAGSASYQILLTQKQTFFDRFRSQPATSGNTKQRIDGVLADAMIKSDQAQTKDKGVISFDNYEPGYPTNYHFSFEITSDSGPVDPVTAHRFVIAEDTNTIVLPESHKPVAPVASLLALSAPNVVIEDLRPSSDRKPGDYVLRLQEIAGKHADLHISFPLPPQSIVETDMTEEHVLHPVIQGDVIPLSPYQTVTLRVSFPRSSNRSTATSPGEMN